MYITHLIQQPAVGSHQGDYIPRSEAEQDI